MAKVILEFDGELNEDDLSTINNLMAWNMELNTRYKFLSQVEPEGMQTLKDIKEKREEKTIYLLISTLANMMCAKEDIIIDLLSGYLWTEEEGNKLKRSA